MEVEDDDGNNSDEEVMRPIMSTQIALIDSVVVFRRIDSDIFGRVLIENISKNSSIMYKFKGLTINKFQVRPLIGIIEQGEMTSVHIDLHWSTDPWSVNQDLFNILVVSIPSEFTSLTPSCAKFQSIQAYNTMLKEFWKDLRDNGVEHENYTLVCSIDKNIIHGAAGEIEPSLLGGFRLFPSSSGGGIDDFHDPEEYNDYFNLNGYENENEIKRLERMMNVWANCTNNLHDKLYSMERTIWMALCVIIILITTFGITLHKYKNLHEPINISVQVNESLDEPEFINMLQNLVNNQQAAIQQQKQNSITSPGIDVMVQGINNLWIFIKNLWGQKTQN